MESRKSRRIESTKYVIESERIPKSFDQARIVLLSDLHCNVYGKENDELIHRIQLLHPEVIMISGDMIVANGKNYEIAFSLLKRLSAQYPIYYVPGNHEIKMAIHKKTRHDYHTYRRNLRSIGIHFLNNKSCDWYHGSEKIRVTGLNLRLRCYHKFWKSVSLPASYPYSVIGAADKENYQILLAHHPDYYDEYCRWGADLVLAGHIHGGIVRLPILGGVISPSLELFPTYDAGMYRRGSHRMIVSRGLGLHTIKFRLFNRPELALIILQH